MIEADAVLWAELHERGITDLDAVADDEVVDLALRYAVSVPVDTFVQARAWAGSGVVGTNDPRVLLG